MNVLVEGISHAYAELQVLDGIDIAIADGEIVALVGPSGCGKSTLLAIIGGLLQPARGRVRLVGAPPPDSLNPFTYVFQDFALLPWRTVAGNVRLPLEHRKLDRGTREALVDDALRRTGLGEFRDAYPKQLSGGMRQRVGIARALAVRPAVLLLDEPLSALDAQTRELLMEDFLALWLTQRISTVYVTHNLGEAVRLADRIVVLSRRPARIKAVVPVPIPQRERTALALLQPIQDQLWHLIRDEAQRAEREVVDA